ncbi:hypothetical protein ABKV19_020251 [Rosa sericea]
MEEPWNQQKSLQRKYLRRPQTITMQMRSLVKDSMERFTKEFYPEYFQSNQLTERSDVNSFGVVLAELLTSRVALSFARPDVERCPASFFVSSIEKDCLIEILDADIVNA